MADGTDAERLRWLTDRELVRDVIVRCALAQDAHDWVALADCFEKDAVYVHPSGRLDGADAIVQRSKAALEQLDASQHLIGSVLVAVEGGEASGTSYFQAQHVRAGVEGGDFYVIAGTYRDRLSRGSGTWRIAERVQSYAWRQGNREVVRR